MADHRHLFTNHFLNITELNLFELKIRVDNFKIHSNLEKRSNWAGANTKPRANTERLRQIFVARQRGSRLTSNPKWAF